MSYNVSVKDYEGPIDLLLFFIKRDKLNIYDIPISKITKDFLEYIEIMEVFNIDIGGEFISMASLLMKIKSKMLLPDSGINEDDIEDPRQPLIDYILEYKKYKKLSYTLNNYYENHFKCFAKGIEFQYENESNLQVELIDQTIYNLSIIYSDLINESSENKSYIVYYDKVNVDDQISYLNNQILSLKKINFTKIIPILKSKLHIVVTFLAILEMLRTNQITAKQDDTFGDLILEKQ